MSQAPHGCPPLERLVAPPGHAQLVRNGLTLVGKPETG